MGDPVVRLDDFAKGTLTEELDDGVCRMVRDCIKIAVGLCKLTSRGQIGMLLDEIVSIVIVNLLITIYASLRRGQQGTDPR